MHILLSVVRYCCSRYRTDALLHASTDKVLTCMRDDKSMTRLVMYPLETRLDAFHCRYDDDSWHVLFLQSHGALPQSMEEVIDGL